MKVLQIAWIVAQGLVKKVPTPVWVILVGIALGFYLRGCVIGPKVQPVVSGNTSTYTLPKTDLKPGDVAPIITSPVVQPLVQAHRTAGKKVEVVAQATGTVTTPASQTPTTQPIEAIAVVSKDDKGQPSATIDLFKVEPNGTRTPLADSKTTVVVAQPQSPRWRLGFAVQAGAGYVTETSTFKATPMATVALQWLARGSSRAAEDKTWAVASPAVLLTTGSVEPGILPLSVNLGRIPHQPLKDLWLSPFIGYKSKGLGHVGVVLTATF